MDSLNRRTDATAAFAGIRKPTLVIHCRDDVIMPLEEGRHLASTIPGAQLLSLPTGTHYFPTGDEITRRIVDGIVRFVG
jgi:pimeloyl-ACP methyl ester carboxylesterase